MLTEADAAVLQQVTQVVKHGFLVLTANATEVAQKATAAGHHLWKGNLLRTHTNTHVNQQHYSTTHKLITWLHVYNQKQHRPIKEAHNN